MLTTVIASIRVLLQLLITCMSLRGLSAVRGKTYSEEISCRPRAVLASGQQGKKELALCDVALYAEQITHLPTSV